MEQRVNAQGAVEAIKAGHTVEAVWFDEYVRKSVRLVKFICIDETINNGRVVESRNVFLTEDGKEYRGYPSSYIVTMPDEVPADEQKGTAINPIQNAYQHFVIEALKAINASEIIAYSADEGQFVAAAGRGEDFDRLERATDDLHVFTGRMYGYVRQIVYDFEPNADNQRILETISQMGQFGLNEIIQVLLPHECAAYLKSQERDTPILTPGEIEIIMKVVISRKWVTVETAAEHKGVNTEVLRRLLRDETRQRRYFPTAREPFPYWLLCKREVDRWQPAEVGRPRRRDPIDELNDMEAFYGKQGD